MKYSVSKTVALGAGSFVVVAPLLGRGCKFGAIQARLRSRPTPGMTRPVGLGQR